MKKLYFFIGFLCIQSLALHAQIKVDANNFFKMPEDKSIVFADKWALEHTTSTLNGAVPGFNLYQYHVANYRFFLADATGRIGIGTGNPLYGKIEINSSGLSNGFTINTSGRTRISMGLDAANDYAYLVRNGDWSKGIVIASNGYIGLNRVPSYRLDVNGIIRADNVSITSDERLKKNILTVGIELDKLKSIKSYSYNLKSIKYNKDSTTNTHSIEITDTLNSRIHYGFKAQELQTIFPELVYEDVDGILSVNYIGLIPLLVEAYKLQSNKISELEQQLQDCCNKNNDSKLKSEQIETVVTDISTQSSLSQNRPNPFSQNTIIEMSIPSTITTATVYIYDLKGVQIKSMQIAGRGNTSVTIYASELTAGMYIYSLVTDGVLVNSKQMILTE